MSTATINSLTLKAVVDGTEIIEISELGAGSFKTPLSNVIGLLSINGDTNSAQSLLGVSNRTTVQTTGGGVTTFDINAAYVGQATITTLGTITTGVWTGTDILFANIQDITTSRILGRVTAATGVIEELTGTQATTLLDVFTSVLQGLVPASGGGTTNFLRADGTFAAPPAGGITTLNTLTATTQTFAVAQADELAISSVTSTHTFSIGANIPRLDESNIFTLKPLIVRENTGTFTKTNPGIVLDGTYSIAANGRGILSEQVIDATGTIGYSMFDAAGGTSTIVALNYSHLNGFQSRPNHGSTGTLTTLRGYRSSLTGSGGSGVITDAINYDINTQFLGGTATNQYGFRVGAVLNNGTADNFAFYSVNGNTQRFGGDVIQEDDGTAITYDGIVYSTTVGHGFNVVGSKSDGTKGAEIAIPSDSKLLFLAGKGHDGTAFSNTQVGIIFESSETWTGSAHGTKITWFTTPNGSLTSTERWILAPDGTVRNFIIDANATGNAITNIEVADLANGIDGELITWDAAGAPATVATGTLGQVLTSNGVGTAPTFQANPAGFADPMTTRGDIIIRNASNVTDRLAVGTPGQVLTSDGTDISWGAAGAGDMILASIQIVTGAKTFGTIGGAVGKFILAGSTSGSTILNAAAVAGSTTLTLPGSTDTLIGKATTDILTNKTVALGSNTVSGTAAQFDTAVTDDNIAYEGAANAWGTVNQNIAATGKWQEGGVNISPIGVHDIWVSAAGMWATATAGSADITRFEFATNDVNIQTLDFNDTTEENAQFTVSLPRNYNNGTITATFYWTSAAGLATEDVDWGIKAVAISNDDPLDAAFGGEVSTQDVFTAQDDLQTVTSNAITIGGTPADADMIQFNIARKTGTDNLTGDAKLIGVVVHITTDAAVAA